MAGNLGKGSGQLLFSVLCIQESGLGSGGLVLVRIDIIILILQKFTAGTLIL